MQISSSRRHPLLLSRLLPVASVAAMLVAAVTFWGVWRSEEETPITMSDDVAQSSYDLSVTPLTDEEYEEYLYYTYVDLRSGEESVGVSRISIADEEIGGGLETSHIKAHISTTI